MFARFKEIRRLRRELAAASKRETGLNKKIEVLEAKLETRIELLLERDFAWSDRFLISQAKTYAMADEVKSKVAVTDVDVKKKALDEFLMEKREFLRECAAETSEAENDPVKIDQMVDAWYAANFHNYEFEFEAGYR